jgi:hypothetical protein
MLEVEGRLEAKIRKEVEGRLEAKIRKEYEEKYKKIAKRQIEETRVLVAAERKAETAVAKFNAGLLELAKWRMREHRAKSALRDMFVRAKDNKLARARPTLV